MEILCQDIKKMLQLQPPIRVLGVRHSTVAQPLRKALWHEEIPGRLPQFNVGRRVSLSDYDHISG